MVRAFLPKAVLLLVLCMVLALPPLQAAEPGLHTRHVSPGSALWEVFAWAWTHLTKVWAANGCILDPDGHCLSSATAEADNGCLIDPNGRCGS